MTEPYRNSQLPISTRVSNLLGQMSREEKIGQLGQVCMRNFDQNKEDYFDGVRSGKWGSRILAETAWAGNNTESALNVSQLNEIQRVAVEESRLGIPILYGRDVIYGHRTIFPIPLSQAASFNPELVEIAMSMVAAEATSEGIHWTFSPMMDIARDPRWGRVIECAGEDPYLAAQMSVAAIKGFQGSDPADPDRLLACAKHFAGYGGSEGGRDYDTTEWTENTLHNMVLPVFRAAAEAGVASMMAGFNDLGGTPVSSSRSLIRDWLKGEVQWGGFIVSDWGSIFDLMGHGVAADERAAARLAFTAGIDMEMTAGIYERQIGALIDSGEMPSAWLDDAVSRILHAKFMAGLFEHPYTDPERAVTILRHPDHLDLAVKLATQSIVLLKNERSILPLQGGLKKIAILGPYAEARREHLGSWCLDGRPNDVTSILDAMRAAKPDLEIITAPSGFSDAMINAARAAELTILCIGESHLRNGENRSIAELALPPGQEELIAAMGRLGLPFIVVDCSGRHLPSPASEAYALALLHAGCLGTEAGTAIARILLGMDCPSGKLPMTIPRSTGQIPIYYNRKTVGKTVTFLDRYRGYEDERLSPLYCFGHGLSYTRFSLSEFILSAETMPINGEVTFSALLSNIGIYEGEEVVQLYIGDPVASTGRPARELKGFKRVALAPGASQTVTFTITARELSFYSVNRKWEVETGLFRLAIGNSSDHPFTHQLMVV